VPGVSRGKGTFRETWTLCWQPEFDLALIERAALGTTVSGAATQQARDLASGAVAPPSAGHPSSGGSPQGPGSGPPGPRAGAPGPGGVGQAGSLADLTALVERCLLADLPEALPEVLAALSARAALDTDVTHLMAALPAMVRAHRYGDVRGTSAEGLEVIVHSMVDRICVGLPVSVTGLDDGAAADLLGHVDAVHTAVALLDEGAGQARTPEPGPDEGAGQAGTSAPMSGEGGARVATPRSRWLVTLRGICDRQDLHGLIEGRLTRILLDAGDLDDAGNRMSRAMSRGQTPVRAAAWVEGFLSGGGLLLVHDPRLLALVDAWLTGLGGEQFIEVLPLLRRTFGGFAVPERRAIGERVRSGGRHAEAAEAELDERRAAAAAKTVLAILGRARG
jgi:hypothetical protein